MKKILFAVTLFAFPFVAAAEPIRDADSLLRTVNNFINAAIPVLISVAVVFLIYAIVAYIVSGSEDKKEAAKNMMIWGVIGLFFILSIWGIVNVLIRTFNLDNNIDRNAIPSALPIRNNI